MAKCGGVDTGSTVAVPLDRIRSAEARRRGRELFLQDCALCHGMAADGRGVRSMGLDRKPADFTNPAWGAKDAPARAYEAIRNGVAGTAMPSWSGALSEDDSWDLVAYLVSVSATSLEKR
jgi:mono/diheme cytochrome c family protein